MTGKEAYHHFMNGLKKWLPSQVLGSQGLLHMVRGMTIRANKDYEYVAVFPGPGRRKAYLCFAQNMIRNDRNSKVFAVEFSVGSKLNRNWLQREAARMLPAGESGPYDSGKGERFFVQFEWGTPDEYDRLLSDPLRIQLYYLALDALRFADHALQHETML